MPRFALCLALAVQATLAATVTPLAVRAQEATAPPSASASPSPSPPTPPPTLEGAIGLLVHDTAAYPGANTRAHRFSPAGFLRWGRLTLTGAGGFTTRRSDEVERGLGAELIRRENVQLSLGLRVDGGRRESASARLAGMGDVRRTVRARLSARWDPAEHWRLGFGVSIDAANRVGGYVVDGFVARQWLLDKDASVTVSAALTGAGDRYMQAWYGVSPEQSARTGLPAHAASEGLRDIQLGIVWRREFSRDWAGFAGMGLSRLLGGAADSPLTQRPGSWSASAGIVRRF